MRDARYLRAQAKLCLEMARQMSDPTTSDNLHPDCILLSGIAQPPLFLLLGSYVNRRKYVRASKASCP